MALLTDSDIINFMVRRKHGACTKFQETCEAGCGKANHIDNEGVPLCCSCVEMLHLEDLRSNRTDPK